MAGINDVITRISLFGEDDEWSVRLAQWYYQAMVVSLEMWLRQKGYPNPEVASDIANDWFIKEVGGKFPTVRGFRAKREQDEAEAKARATALANQTTTSSADFHAAAPQSKRRRFRDYLFVSLKHFAVDWLRREARTRGIPIPDDWDVADHRSTDEEDTSDGESMVFVLGWDITHDFSVFCQLMKAFKAKPVSRQARGKNRELPSWWTMLEVRLLRPLLLGEPPTPHTVISDQFHFSDANQDGKPVRNAFTSLFRALCREARPPKDLPVTHADWQIDADEFVRNVAQLPEKIRRLPESERVQLEPLVARALHDAIPELLDLLDEPLAGEVTSLSLARTAEAMSEIATDFTDSDRCEAWTTLLAKPIKELAGFSPATVAESLTSGDVATLRGLKDIAKENQKKVDSDFPTEIWQLLYLVTLATALGRHDERITSLLDVELEMAWKACVELPWPDQSTRQFIENARRRLSGIE